MADWVLVDHPPAATLLDEEPRGHCADNPVLVGAVVDPVRVHQPVWVLALRSEPRVLHVGYTAERDLDKRI